jgi:hypothetical protein
MIRQEGGTLIVECQNDGRLRHDCPQLWQAIYGKKYLVPNYRQLDYVSQDKMNGELAFGILATAMGLLGYEDDVHHAQYANYCGALWHERPILFLEKELGGPLLESALPKDMVVEDIEWVWPQFRVYLPKGLLAIEREGQPRSLTHLDICRLDEEGLCLPPKYGQELEHFIEKEAPDLYTYKKRIPATKLIVQMGEPYMAVSGNLDWSEIGASTGTAYASIMPWSNKKLGELLAIRGGLNTPLACDKADDKLLERMLSLALQMLLFLSQKPVIYKPEVVRAMRQEGKHRIKPALHRAFFVGEQLYRPSPAVRKHHAATGKHYAAQWRKGHWKRVAYGPKHAERRFQWISIYHTFGPDGPEADTQAGTSDS